MVSQFDDKQDNLLLTSTEKALSINVVNSAVWMVSLPRALLSGLSQNLFRLNGEARIMFLAPIKCCGGTWSNSMLVSKL